MKVAAINWNIEPTDDLEVFLGHAERLVRAAEGSELIVLPELPCLELLGGRPDLAQCDIAAYLADFADPMAERFGQFSQTFACTLVGGTTFVREGSGIENRAVVAFPDGTVTTDVPKVVMTRFEDEDWRLQAGRGLRTFADSPVGVTVCYDCEFPESGRALAESGMQVQVVPAFTETRHGFGRVRWSCHARAIENQLFVVHASLVGSLGREPVVSAVGSSAVLTPPIEPFPPGAVLAETAFGVEGVALAEIDFATLLKAREGGDVRNWYDRNRGDWTVSPAT